MDLESIMLSETSQAVKHKYHMISPISGTQHNKQMSKIDQRLGKKELTVTRGKAGGDNRGKKKRGNQNNTNRGLMDTDNGGIDCGCGRG